MIEFNNKKKIEQIYRINIVLGSFYNLFKL